MDNEIEQKQNGQADKNDKDKEPKTITVLVNKQPVSFSQHKVSGLQIKETAMNQGVNIQLDFNLFEIKGTQLDPISDNQEVTIHKNQEFRAVTSDDNSKID